MTTHPNARSKATRYIELENMLKERCLELSNEVKDRKRDARTDNAKDHAVLDEGESSQADTQEEIEFALIQMKAEMLSKITAALHRLRDGSYGSCMECANDIPETRLRVLLRGDARSVKKLASPLSGGSASWRNVSPPPAYST